MRPTRSKSVFARMAKWTARATGRPITFALAALVVLVWLVTGPLFGYSDTWQLVINTGTTVVTFLMVFLIQSTQNRDTEALSLQRQQFELVQKQYERHERLQERAELLQGKSAQLIGVARKMTLLVLPLLVALLGYVTWLIFR